jgi:hypothetical protein
MEYFREQIKLFFQKPLVNFWLYGELGLFLLAVAILGMAVLFGG